MWKNDRSKGKFDWQRDDPPDDVDQSELERGRVDDDDIKGNAEDRIGNARRRVGNALDDLGHKIKP